MKFDLQRFSDNDPGSLTPTPGNNVKSYTLADHSTVTVTATANGVEFNEGMGALTKAIKAKINASSGGGASSCTLTAEALNWDEESLTCSVTQMHGGIRVYDFPSDTKYIDVTYTLG